MKANAIWLLMRITGSIRGWLRSDMTIVISRSTRGSTPGNLWIYERSRPALQVLVCGVNATMLNDHRSHTCGMQSSPISSVRAVAKKREGGFSKESRCSISTSVSPSWCSLFFFFKNLEWFWVGGDTCLSSFCHSLDNATLAGKRTIYFRLYRIIIHSLRGSATSLEYGRSIQVYTHVCTAT